MSLNNLSNNEAAAIANAMYMLKDQADAAIAFQAHCTDCGKEIKGDEDCQCFTCALEAPSQKHQSPGETY